MDERIKTDILMIHPRKMTVNQQNNIRRAMIIVLPLLLAAMMISLVFAAANNGADGTFSRLTIASSSDRFSRDPSFNSDGSVIAFSSDSDFFNQGISTLQGEIWLYHSDTLTFTRVTTSASDRINWEPRLNADGTIVAFYGNADLLNQGIPSNQVEIWLYDTNTLTYTRVTTASHSNRSSYSPVLNAQGNMVAFVSDSDFLGQGVALYQTEVWLYDTATMTVTRITTATTSDRTSYLPDINQDGTKIGFMSDSDFLGQGVAAYQNEIWLYDTTTMTYTRITYASAPDRSCQYFTMDDDGTRFAMQSNADYLNESRPKSLQEIWLYDTSMLTYTRVTSASHSDRGSYNPEISGDGRYIVFQSDSDFLNQGIQNGQEEIWLYDIPREKLTRLTTASASDRKSVYPDINTTGKFIAFFSDSDFLSQGIVNDQYEVWLWEAPDYPIYLPVVIR